MNIDDTTLEAFRTSPLKKITGVFGRHLRKREFNIDRVRETASESGYTRPFCDAAIRAWISAWRTW